MKKTLAPEIKAMAAALNLAEEDCLKALQTHYDGYHFAPRAEGIYNPFSLLNALADRRFNSYWFATGTPISNSMTEMYTMQRYLQYGTLRRNNMTHFDSWASTFGETTTAIELAPSFAGVHPHSCPQFRQRYLCPAALRKSR